jgi:acetolactate synthase I/II/III large subunit
MREVKTMNGAESLLRTLLGGGIDTCFANPGTSEMQFVAALDRVPGMRPILCLFEGVASGAADGYARMTGRPAATLLHCGPGLGYAVTNLHNARRAASPIVNIVGDHATYHRPLDPPLASDIEGLARPFSHWVRTATSAATLGIDAAAAIESARSAPGQIATLIAPSDTAWDDGGIVAPVAPPRPSDRVATRDVDAIALLLRRGEPTVMLLTGAALREPGLSHAKRIADSSGCALLAEFTNGRFQRGRGHASVARMPWGLDQARASLADMRHLVLVGARKPVAFFAHPGKPRQLWPDTCEVHLLARPDQDIPEALHQLADALQTKPSLSSDEVPRPEVPQGPITSDSVARLLAALMPEQTIIVDESVSFGRGLFSSTAGAPPHDWLHQTGGAIGAGLPLATGAAIGAPGRRVIVLQADGSAMYTPQALWTQARERLDVTTIILANRRYAVLAAEAVAVGAQPGPRASNLIDIGNPDLKFVNLAATMGIEAVRARSLSRLADLLSYSCSRPGPFLIELMI